MMNLPDWRYVALAGLVIFVLIVMFLVANRPSSSADCACDVSCTYPTVTTAYQDGWDYTLCPAGCWIKSVEYEDIAGGGQYKITCACCDCVPEVGPGALGTCNYGNPVFDFIGVMLHLCAWPTS